MQTTDSNHDQPIAPNRLAEAATPVGPDRIWVADITYVQTREGWLYVAARLDMHSRRIAGWAMGERIDTALVLSALNMALPHQKPSAGAWASFATREQARTEIFDFIKVFYNRQRSHNDFNLLSLVDLELLNN